MRHTGIEGRGQPLTAQQVERPYPLGVAQLKLNAIDAQLLNRWLDFLWIFRVARWELTCGFCRMRFKKDVYWVASWIDCPGCGTRNLLPVVRFRSDPGPRP